jgi:hypothetical protein
MMNFAWYYLQLLSKYRFVSVSKAETDEHRSNHYFSFQVGFGFTKRPPMTAAMIIKKAPPHSRKFWPL